MEFEMPKEIAGIMRKKFYNDTECSVCKKNVSDATKYIFVGKNKAMVTVCEQCLCKRPDEVEKIVATHNVN